MHKCQQNAIIVIKERVLSAIYLHNIVYFSLIAFNTYLVHCFTVVLYFLVQYVYRRFYIIYSGLF